MYHTATYFIKAQYPTLTLQDLLLLYRDELENEGGLGIVPEDDAVSFTNSRSSTGFASYGRFAVFSTGTIRITDTGDEYHVDFSGTMHNPFTRIVMIVAGAALVLTAITGTNIFLLLLVAVLYLFIVGAGYLQTIITFPIYFVALRNRIEQHVEAGW